MSWNRKLTKFTQKDIFWDLLLCHSTWIKGIIGRKPEAHPVEMEEKDINFQNTLIYGSSTVLYLYSMYYYVVLLLTSSNM